MWPLFSFFLPITKNKAALSRPMARTKKGPMSKKDRHSFFFTFLAVAYFIPGACRGANQKHCSGPVLWRKRKERERVVTPRTRQGTKKGGDISVCLRGGPPLASNTEKARKKEGTRALWQRDPGTCTPKGPLLKGTTDHIYFLFLKKISLPSTGKKGAKKKREAAAKRTKQIVEENKKGCAWPPVWCAHSGKKGTAGTSDRKERECDGARPRRS